jgi:hypothetical protein
MDFWQSMRYPNSHPNSMSIQIKSVLAILIAIVVAAESPVYASVRLKPSVVPTRTPQSNLIVANALSLRPLWQRLPTTHAASVQTVRLTLNSLAAPFVTSVLKGRQSLRFRLFLVFVSPFLDIAAISVTRHFFESQFNTALSAAFAGVLFSLMHLDLWSSRSDGTNPEIASHQMEASSNGMSSVRQFLMTVGWRTAYGFMLGWLTSLSWGIMKGYLFIFHVSIHHIVPSPGNAPDMSNYGNHQSYREGFRLSIQRLGLYKAWHLVAIGPLIETLFLWWTLRALGLRPLHFNEFVHMSQSLNGEINLYCFAPLLIGSLAFTLAHERVWRMLFYPSRYGFFEVRRNIGSLLMGGLMYSELLVVPYGFFIAWAGHGAFNFWVSTRPRSGQRHDRTMSFDSGDGYYGSAPSPQTPRRRLFYSAA